MSDSVIIIKENRVGIRIDKGTIIMDKDNTITMDTTKADKIDQEVVLITTISKMDNQEVF